MIEDRWPEGSGLKELQVEDLVSVSLPEELLLELARFGVTNLSYDAISRLQLPHQDDLPRFTRDWFLKRSTQDPDSVRALSRVIEAVEELIASLNGLIKCANAESKKAGNLNVAKEFFRSIQGRLNWKRLDFMLKGLLVTADFTLKLGHPTKKGRPPSHAYNFYISVIADLCRNHEMQKARFADILLACETLILPDEFRAGDRLKVCKRLDEFLKGDVSTLFAVAHPAVTWLGLMREN